MDKDPHILILEDFATDAELIRRELSQAKIKFSAQHVETKEAFEKALIESAPDIILSDFNLPQFNALEALRLFKQSKLDVPFILVTGSLTEEVAVECMKQGADDYILKSSLKRLPSAVLNALKKKAAEHEKKKAEGMLRQHEEQFRLITEHAHDLICLLDLKGKFTYLSPSFKESLGYAPEELIGRESLSLVHPDEREMVAKQFLESTSNGNNPSAEFRCRHRNGEWRFFESIRNWVLDAQGERQTAVIVSRDITERKRAEDALRDSEQRYRLLSEGIPHQAWTAQPNGKLDYVNERTQKYFQQTMEQLLEGGWQSVVHPDDLSLCVERWTSSLQTGANYEVEFRLRRADGEYRWHSGRATAGRDVEGSIFKWFGTNTDINDQKLAEEALHKSEEQLLQSQKMESIGTLAGGVAHDFNNILTAILGNAQLALTRFQIEEPLQHRLIEIEKAGKRAAGLTRQLLAFSRRQRLERRTLNLNELITEIMKMVQRIIGADIEVRIKAAEDLSRVFADAAQLEQVLMNLAVNARDAMPSGGTLTIETLNTELDEAYRREHSYVQPGNYVQLRVSDTGTGMDAQTQARIFEPFFTTKDIGKGTGLGLAMVYGIIKQHDGLIHVYSEVGHGTTFKIYLPVDEKSIQKEKESAELPLRGGQEIILLAEDEEPLRELALDVLGGLGYTVMLASNGVEALELYTAHRAEIDLVMLDMVMPRMGGYEAYEQMRAQRKDVPVIFMTGYSAETVQSRFVKQNKPLEELNAALIQKPYSVEGLGRKVREVLDATPKQRDV